MAITLDGTDGITTTGLTSSGIDDNATSTAITIDANEHVGIGTTNPSETLTVFGTIQVERSTAGIFKLKRDDTVTASGNGLGEIHAVTNHGGTDYIASKIRFEVGDTNGASGEITLETSGSERMRIDSNGNLLIGATSPVSLGVLEVTSPESKRAHEFYKQTAIASSAVGAWRSDVGSTANIIARVMADGDLQNATNSYGGISDERFKSNIVDANPQLDDIMAVQVRSYTLDSTGATHIGVVAQELEAAGMSGLVKEDEDGIKSVKYSILYMKAIKAIQEQQAMIEELKVKVAALEAN